ncbi:acyl-CoA N-acyltransferase [Panaeolus papilionaceus]|nr:acyl-CoA N-acyltransferase [Panaeolus papilionaceus]
MHRDLANRGYIAMLSVDKQWRKRGIATTLVQKSIQAMKQEGVDEIVLETEYDNYAALSLYESLGFIREKRLYRFYLNGKDAFRLVLAMPTDGSSSDDDDERSHLPPMMRSSKFRRHMARRVIRISAYDDNDEDDVSGR